MRIETEKVIIETENGYLEALLDKQSQNVQFNDYFAVCCHPHSLHGGTLTNKVVHTLSRAMASKGIPSIRFNFRGVGKSDGQFDDGIGEQEDLTSVVNWMQARYPNRQLILGGFSFGAFVSIMAAKSLNPHQLISIAPPVGRFDFSSMEVPSCQWSIIQGEEDELVKCEDVENWSKGLGDHLSFIKVGGASHFFHGKLVELRTIVEAVIY